MLRKLMVVAALVVGLPFAAAAPSLAQGSVRCADEGGYCRAPYGTVVYFGTPGSTISREVGGNGIPCNTRAFGGDPNYGVRKFCSYFVQGNRGGRDYDRGYDRRDRGYRRDY